MRYLKEIAALALLLLVAGGGYFVWQYVTNEPVETQAPRGGGGPVVETAPVTLSEVQTLVEAVGSTRARQAVEITPTSSGRITEINFHAGQPVNAGDVLLRLDDDIQRADLIEAEARLREATHALERGRALMKSSATSQAAVEKLVAELAIVTATRDRATRRMRDRIVTAPFDGVVGFSRVEIGGRIQEGAVITTLDDLSIIEIEFAIPESLFGQVSPGKPIVADASAFPDRAFEGTIERIDSRIDPISRAFKARAPIANPDNTLPSGMFMHLAVVLDIRRALNLPEEAIVVEGSQPYVFVVVSGERGLVAERRNIKIGQRSFGIVEILDGVTEGESVIIRGVQKARDGQAVRKAGPRGGTQGGSEGGPPGEPSAAPAQPNAAG